MQTPEKHGPAEGETNQGPSPDWIDEMVEAFGEMAETTGNIAAEERELAPITNYSTFFGEWVQRGDDVLIHLFPRAGAEDIWESGHYINRCMQCRREVPQDVARERKPCPRCGNVGLIYIPGRREKKAKTRFPKTILVTVKEATDKVWDGYVAVEYVKELGAVAIQMQDVYLSEEKIYSLMESFFDAVDDLMEAQ